MSKKTPIAQLFRSRFKIEEMSPEEYVARYIHKTFGFGIPFSVHQDPELENWIVVVNEITNQEGRVEELRRLYLTAEEIEKIRLEEIQDDFFF